MTEPLLPNSLLSPQQRQVDSSSHHVHSLPPVPMRFRSTYEVAELTWENGQPVMNGLRGLLPTAQQKPTWLRAHETLESIVHQATCQRQKSNFMMLPQDHPPTSISSSVAPSTGRTAMPPERSAQAQSEPTLARKRVRSDSGYLGNGLEECEPSSGGCASFSATFCRSFKRNKTLEDDSPSLCESENQDQEEDRDTKEETGPSNSTRRNRAAAVHNQSERRRRDRINQKMKALQRLVPNASKNDKASILDEVIEYLKQLQAQIQMMSMRNNMPQQMMMMMMQQQLQMSMMARMGLGLGSGSGQGPGLGLAGLLNANTTMATRPQILPSLPQFTVAAAPAINPSFIMSPLVPPPKPEPASASASVSLPDPYATFLSQSAVNMDVLSNMAALYRQQMRQNHHNNMSSMSEKQHHHHHHHGKGN